MSDQIAEQISVNKETEPRNSIMVLVAEDEESVISLLKETFKMAGGFETNVVKTTADALGILRRAKEENKPIGLVFSDLGLVGDPEGGFKIAEAVRDEGLANYFILFTGNRGKIDNDPQKLKARGIDKLLGKPMSPFDLIPHLNQAKELILLQSQASK